MRAIRPLVLMLIALAGPLSRGDAQTCQGTAAFQDGKAQAGVDDQYNRDFNDVRGTIEYGAPRSFYGGLSLDQLQVGHGGSKATGVGVNLGYQIHLSDTPFQFCPTLSGHYAGSDGASMTQFGFGGSLGYRDEISDWFALVPAAGVWFISTGSNDKGVNIVQPASGPSATASDADNGASNEVFMTIGLVFNKAFTISPGILVPSRSGAKSIYTLGVSINWAK